MPDPQAHSSLQGHAGLQTYLHSQHGCHTEIFCTLGDGTASLIVSNGIGSRFGVFTTAWLTINDAMNALTIPASRPSMRERMRSIRATVSNLRAAIPAAVFLTVAIAAIILFFLALGMMHIPYIVASGSTALTAVALAPMSEKEGGEI